MRRALLLSGALIAGCSPPAPVSVEVQMACSPEMSVLRQRCRVSLTDRRTGRPVEGASVTLHADMPSMPLIHSVRPVTATPGLPPGTYDGTLELEMVGRWVVAVRITGRVNDQATRVLDVSP